MKFDITSGLMPSAQKVVIYGPEGIGKSTFAANAEDAIFIDTEGSTKHLNVKRLPPPTSWSMLLSEVEYIATTPGICKTLVIDTFDKAEQLCIEHVCNAHHKSGIEEFGYGNGYVYVKEELGRGLDKLESVINAGINVILTAHAQIRKFEQPDELGAYDRYELKLGKRTSSLTAPLVKEWADAVLFANYKTYSIAADEQGRKHKAQGGKRVMYTAHHPCWDAKNRWGLPEECELDYNIIAPYMNNTVTTAPTETPATTTPAVAPAKTPKPFTEPPKEEQIKGLPETLTSLMRAENISEAQIREVVAMKGYFPQDMPVAEYPKEFIDGVLIGAWEQVRDMVVDNTLPF